MTNPTAQTPVRPKAWKLWIDRTLIRDLNTSEERVIEVLAKWADVDSKQVLTSISEISRHIRLARTVTLQAINNLVQKNVIRIDERSVNHILVTVLREVML